MRKILLFLIVSVFFFDIATGQKSTKPFTVVLDAGHGGKDPGNMGNGHKEKDIALNIVLEIGKRLENLPSLKVIYTRKTDVFVELKDRANIANKAKADLFVSVHCNYHKSQAEGTETFVLGLAQNKENFEVAKSENSVIFLEDDYQTHYEGFDPNAPETVIGLTLLQEEYTDQSIQLADMIQDNFANQYNRVDRGVKQANLLVIRRTFMPSVLVEVGFLSNYAEGRYLDSTSGQVDMSNAVYQALVRYKSVFYDNQSDYTFDKNNNPQAEDSSQTKSTTTVADFYSQNTKDKIILFKIQLFASAKKISLNRNNFSGLSPVSSEKVGKINRYLYQETYDYSKALKFLKEAQQSGYKDAFIASYEKNKQIPLKKALKKLEK
ncbi:MAG: N-acetylmuramoyl-L-alanine amidase [Flavobacteriales bacterium CG_4_9_14_3_um_filter_40_17]|nr:MAG: N-acetylmuramoyl-L-alanine amidase [Flavobacteriales bacterium CG_4_9_14_3_um_filter_40_17]